MNRQNHNLVRLQRPGPQPAARVGFTLVEMLVSVALVLLIMTLFAQAFSIAASSMRKQRGLAENDQRARSMVTLLLGDLQKRTYRQRADAITTPVNVPVDLDEVASPEDQFTYFIARLQDRANQLSLGLVPLHPDYYIGGAEDDDASASSQGTSGSGAAPREVDSVRERGYFHYSEGDPSDDADDVLKFTINMAEVELGNFVTSRLNGRAVRLLPTWNPNVVGNPFDDIELNTDQPIWDDGIGWVENPLTGFRRSYNADEPGTTASRVAEVAIFIRNGKLYRRVNLIREPLANVFEADIGEGQPNLDGGTGPGTGGRVFDAANPNYTADSFWNDFDHGATRAEGNDNPLHFTDIATLDNTIGGETTLNTGSMYPEPPHRYWSLGDPRNRFCHDNVVPFPPMGELLGRPKEYMDPTDKLTFIGCYIHEETSSPRFLYPGQPAYAGGPTSPMRWGSLPPAAGSDMNGDGRIDLLDDFDDGPREGEDLLLANCHAFDVKVWDDALNQFVDLGHSTNDGAAPPNPLGDLHVRTILDNRPAFQMAMAGPAITDTGTPGRFQGAQRQMGRYGGLQTNENRIFDTWHPAFNFTNDLRPHPSVPGGAVRPDNDPPPYRPLWTDRDNFDTAFPTGGSGGARPLFWTAGQNYTQGDRVFPRPNRPDGPNTLPMPPHLSFFYVAVEAVDTDGDGDIQSNVTNQPNWPESPGARITDTGPGGDRIVWKAIPNTVGLKAIQVSLRFFDPTSGQMRQLTLTHSFVEL